MTEKFIEWTNEIDEALKEHNVEFEFEKRDGTIRKMMATMVVSSIPEEKLPKGVKSYDRTKIARVFDTEKSDWRTISKDRLISWKIAD